MPVCDKRNNECAAGESGKQKELSGEDVFMCV